MVEIIGHSAYSRISARLISDATQKYVRSGQCYAIASLSALWLCRGEEGRNEIFKYCRILNELDNLSNRYSNLIELINDICQGKAVSHDESLTILKDLDPDFSTLKNIPMLAVIHYLFMEPEKLPDFPKIVNEPPLLDQDFTEVHRLLSLIETNDDLILKLKELFPGYKTIDGQTFEEDFKRIQSSWRCKNGNDVTKKIPAISLNMGGLRKFCQWIKTNIDKYPVHAENKTIQLILSSNTHGLTLQYDRNANKWYMIDSLELTIDNLCNGDENITELLFDSLTYNSKTVKFSSEIILDKQFNSDILNLDEFSRFSSIPCIATANNERFYFTSSKEFKLYTDNDYEHIDELILAAFSTKHNIKGFSLTADDFYKYVLARPKIAGKLIDTVFKIPEQVENFIRNIDDIFTIYSVYPKFNLILDKYENLKKHVSIQFINSYLKLAKILEIFPSMEEQLIKDALLPENIINIFKSIEYLVDFITKYPLYTDMLVENIMSSAEYFKNLFTSGIKFLTFIDKVKIHAEKLTSFALACPENQRLFDSYATLEGILLLCPESKNQVIQYALLNQNVTRIFCKFNTLKKFISSYPEYTEQLFEKLLENNLNVSSYYPNTLDSIISLAPACVEKIFNYALSSKNNFTRIFNRNDLTVFLLNYPALANKIIDFVSSSNDLLKAYWPFQSSSLLEVSSKFPSFAKQLIRLALMKRDDAEMVQLYCQNKDIILQLNYHVIKDLYFDIYESNGSLNIQVCVDLLTNPDFKHLFEDKMPDSSASTQILRKDIKEIILDSHSLAMALFESNPNYFDTWSQEDLCKLARKSSKLSTMLRSNGLILEKIKNFNPYENIDFDSLAREILDYSGFNRRIIDIVRILKDDCNLGNSDKVVLFIAYLYWFSLQDQTEYSYRPSYLFFDDRESRSSSVAKCYDYLEEYLHLTKDNILNCLIALKHYKRTCDFADDIRMHKIDHYIMSLSSKSNSP